MELKRAFGTTGRSGARVLLAFALAGTATAQVTTRVSLNSSGAQVDQGGNFPSISPDRRYVAFSSWSENLVAGDTNGFSDVFVRDRQTGTVERVNVHSSGAQANDQTFGAAISDDGRYVAFATYATNLVDGDTNDTSDVFVRDRLSGTTERVSVSSSEAEGDSYSSGPLAFSSDGRYLAFASDASNFVGGDFNGTDVFVRDRLLGTTERVSVDSSENEVDGGSGRSLTMTPDGRFVAFGSVATNLVAGDGNGTWDGFVRDRQLGTTERVTVHTSGAQGNHISAEFDISISADGRFVTFTSLASNLVAGDTNAAYDVFLRDRQSGTTERISVSSSEAQSTGGYSYGSKVSDDGRYVAFMSFATNLVAGDTNACGDLFVRDRQSGTTERVSVSSSGAQGNDASAIGNLWMSPDGRYLTFDSAAFNLVSGDTNGADDIFIRDRGPTTMIQSCEPGLGGVLACPCSNAPGGFERGCDNSANTGGASLATAGDPDLSTDTLVFTTSGQIPSTLSVLVQGNAAASSGAIYGRGVRCAGGVLRTLYTKTASGGSITAPDAGAGDPTVSARSAAVGDPLAAAQTRWYFVAYRDPVAVCPAPFAMTLKQTFNATQTWQVIWQP